MFLLGIYQYPLEFSLYIFVTYLLKDRSAGYVHLVFEKATVHFEFWPKSGETIILL